MSAPTPEQMRAMGYAANAEPVKLSPEAFVCFCAWVNISPEKMPPMTRYKPRETAEAWERVAEAQQNELERRHATLDELVAESQQLGLYSSNAT